MTDIINDLPLVDENCWPPVRFSWVENDPQYVKGVVRLVFKESGITFFTIVRQRHNLGLFAPVKYKYELATQLRNPESGHRIGGYFDTLKEAKDFAEKLATYILRGNDFAPPEAKTV